MDDLPPAISEPDLADGPPTPPSSGRWAGLVVWLAVVAVVALGAALAFDASLLPTLAAVVLGALILRVGWYFLKTVGTPPPPPPDPGTIRRVRLVYRCSVCGAEVRMTSAPSEDPEAPRHCMEEMDLVTPID